MAATGRRASQQVLAAIPISFLAVLVVWPLAAVLVRSLAGVGLVDAWSILTRSSVLRVVRFTFAQAAGSTVLTLVVGLPIAHALARYDFRGRSTIRAITVVPFVLPTVVVATAFDALFDLINVDLSRTVAAILMAHVFFNVAVVVRMVGGFWRTLDPAGVEAAAALGASPWRAFQEITLRRLAPVVTGAGLIVFLFSFTSFGVILILGGPTRATLETEISRYAVFRGELDVAAILAMIQIAVVAVLAFLGARFQRRLSTATTSSPPSAKRRPATAQQRAHVGAIVGLVAVVIGAPLFALLERSISVGDGYGLANYRALLDPIALLPVSPAGALVRSVVIASLASVVAVLVGLAAGRVITAGGRIGRLLEAAVLIPLGVSAVTLGFGFIIAFTMFDFRSSIWLVPLAHAVIGLPFVLAALLPAWRSVEGSVVEAAAALGASPRQVFRKVEWPLVMGAVATGAGFAAAVSMGEFGATSFISRGSNTFTAPQAIFRLLSQPGDSIRGQAMALSVVVGVVVAIMGAVLERRRTEASVMM